MTKTKKMNKTSPLRISHALAVHGKEEEERVLGVLREHRTMMGKETLEFEKRVARVFGKKYGIMVNSGSSANLIAVELMNLPPGSEVITPILTFATTVAPLVQKGLVPVFVDVLPGRYIIDADKVEAAITNNTKALMIPILMGNVPDLSKLSKIAKKYNLIFIEDSCDAIASFYKGKPTGAYTDITTTSVYGAHIITAGGNGGVIMANSEKVRDRAKVLRGWGRTSALYAELENIKDRFSHKIGNIPYDGKYIFEEIGYNLLPVEICAAFGNAQLDKLKSFIKKRENNAKYIIQLFSKYSDLFTAPFFDKDSKPQLMYFPFTIKKSAPFSRLELITYFEKNNIQTRPIFTGNILKQPGFRNIVHRDTQKNYPVADEIMEQGVIIGLHQGLTAEHLARLTEVVESFVAKYKK